MGLIFIPSNDLSTSAASATSITGLDYGFIQAGETATRAIRIGNLTGLLKSFSLTPASSVAWVAVSPSSFELQSDEISNTVVISIIPPVEAESESHSIDLIASTNSGEQFILRLDFECVGANISKDSQYPERRTSFTDNVSDVILRASEPLRLLTFNPIPLTPNDNRVIVDFTQRRNLDIGGGHRFVTQSVDERLNPLNATWGYLRSESTILGSFQEEIQDIETEFESMRTLMRYSGQARLFVPPEYEFPRMFGLFSVGRNADFDQYKRTVYLIQRRGELWCLHFVATRNRGNELAHHEIDLIQLEDANMGSPDFYNPFAWTWRLESDKPYAMFPVPHNLYSAIPDGSGSLAGSLSS